MRPPVSVLFSEPKIPQFLGDFCGFGDGRKFQCSSASRKFLNWASKSVNVRRLRRFQCSSASRKFLNPSVGTGVSIEVEVSVLFSEPKIPQFPQYTPERPFCQGFSALQRAENSSIRARGALGDPRRQVSVLFSEPKIPQCSYRRGWQSPP